MSVLKTMINIVQNLAINANSVDGVVGICTRDRRIVGTDLSTELFLFYSQYSDLCTQTHQGILTVELTSCLTNSDSTKQVNLLTTST